MLLDMAITFERYGRADRAAALRLRPGTRADAARAGAICFDDFRDIAARHGFDPEVPDAVSAEALAADLFNRDDVYAVVATLDGEIVGSNFLWEFADIAAVGPLTVDPDLHDAGVGRRLMKDVLDRAASRGFAGVRLVQVAYHTPSLSLYLKLGFDVAEPLAVLQGPALNATIPGHTVRAARVGDVAACNALARRVHGHERRAEVLHALANHALRVVEHGGRLTGYTTGIGFFGHTVAETNSDLEALIGAAESFPGPGFLAPTRNGDLMRWCLDHGLRTVQPMTLMTLGLYKTPAGAFLPSILY